MDAFGPLTIMYLYPVIHVWVIYILMKKLPLMFKSNKMRKIALGSSIRKGISIIFGSLPIMLLFVFAGGIESFVSSFHGVLVPIINDQLLGGTGSLVGNVMAAFFVGYTISNFFVARVTDRRTTFKVLGLAVSGLLLYGGILLFPLGTSTLPAVPQPRIAPNAVLLRCKSASKSIAGPETPTVVRHSINAAYPRHMQPPMMNSQRSWGSLFILLLRQTFHNRSGKN